MAGHDGACIMLLLLSTPWASVVALACIKSNDEKSLQRLIKLELPRKVSGLRRLQKVHYDTASTPVDGDGRRTLSLSLSLLSRPLCRCLFDMKGKDNVGKQTNQLASTTTTTTTSSSSSSTPMTFPPRAGCSQHRHHPDPCASCSYHVCHGCSTPPPGCSRRRCGWGSVACCQISSS